MNFIKNALIFAVGGGIGYFVAHFIDKAKYEEKLKAELEDMEDYYISRHPDKKPRSVSYSKPAEDVPADINEAYEKGEYHDYTGYYTPSEEEPADPAENQSPSDDDDDGYYEGLSLEQERRKNKDKAPKLITAADFGNEPGFSTLSLLYYTENDILTIHDEEDNSEDIIYLDEIDDFIGNALEKFEFKTSNEKVIYVRNFKRSTDFEITKVHDYFEE